MRVGGVWAREPKLQQSPRFQPILRQTFGETNNLPCQRYLSPPYVLLNQGGKVHSIDRVGEVLLVHLFGNACKNLLKNLLKSGSTLKWDSPEEDHVLALRSWDPSDARAGSQAQAEHKIMLSNLNNGV